MHSNVIPNVHYRENSSINCRRMSMLRDRLVTLDSPGSSAAPAINFASTVARHAANKFPTVARVLVTQAKSRMHGLLGRLDLTLSAVRACCTYYY